MRPWFTIGQANYNSSNYNLVWDNDSPFGSVVYLDYTHAGAFWKNQVAWASSLNSALTYTLNAGYSVDWSTNSWRLPIIVDGSYSWGYDGTTTAGYNITNSEFGHLFYTELGNKGPYSTGGTYQPDFGLANKGDLTHLQNDSWYWSGTERSAGPGNAWNFTTANGRKDPTYVDATLLGLAVRSAKVVEATPTPIPAAAWLLGSGLMGLVGVRRRVKKS